MRTIAAVIPAFNEAGTIRDVAERTLSQIPWVVVVDDGSTDGTGAALDGLPVTVLRNASNCGKAASLARRWPHALGEGAEAVITLDATASTGRRHSTAAGRAWRHLDAIVIGSRLHDARNIPLDRYVANAWQFLDRVGRRSADRGKPVGFASISRSAARHQPAVRPRRELRVRERILIEAGRRGVNMVAVRLRRSMRRGRRRPLQQRCWTCPHQCAWWREAADAGLYLRGWSRACARWRGRMPRKPGRPRAVERPAAPQ